MPKYIKRWQRVEKGTPAYKDGYRWFDAKVMRHYKKRPARASLQLVTKYSPIRHG